MTTNHTPGPWNVCQIDGGTEDDEIVAEVNGCIVNVCAVFGVGSYSMGTIDGKDEPNYEVSKEEADSNARLIAAAPELLDALEIALDAGNIKYEGMDWRKLARAAIAKATNS